MVVAGGAVLVSEEMILRASGVTVEPGRGLLRRRTIPTAAAEPTA